MKCPHCETVELLMADKQGVEIDYCPKCRGVWLDRGELDRIIERSATYYENQYQGAGREKCGTYDREDHYEHDEHEGKKRKRGGLFDFFDFD